MNNTAIEFECETGYRFWVVCSDANAEACINWHTEVLSYEISDIDQASEVFAGDIWSPPAGEILTGPKNPTSGPGWSFTYAR